MTAYPDDLQRLHKDIWRRTAPDRFGTRTAVESRRLTEAEWIQVRVVLCEQPVAIQMINACFGFGCGIRVWDHPPFPGLPPELLLVVTKEHLPLSEGKDRVLFDEGWERLSPFSHNDENAERLRLLELPEPREKHHYEY